MKNGSQYRVSEWIFRTRKQYPTLLTILFGLKMYSKANSKIAHGCIGVLSHLLFAFLGKWDGQLPKLQERKKTAEKEADSSVSSEQREWEQKKVNRVHCEPRPLWATPLTLKTIPC